MHRLRTAIICISTVFALFAACSDSESPTGPGSPTGYPVTDDYISRVHATRSYFTYISGRASDDIYAVTRDKVIFHFDGASWRNTLPFPDITCYAEYFPLWLTADGVVFVGCGDTIYRRDGTEWHGIQLAPGVVVAGLWGISSDDMVAVGAGTTDGGAISVIYHFDGTVWKSVPHDVTAPLTAVFGAPSGHVFAAGEDGAFLHFDGSTWLALPPPTKWNFSALWAASESLVVAVGQGGTIVHYNGETFETFDSGTMWEIQGVWGNAPNDIYAGGQVYTMFHYDGSSWSAMPEPGYQTEVLWATPEGTLFAGTMSDGIRRFDDPDWATEFTMVQEALYGLWGASHNDVYATGNYNVYHYDGAGWSVATERPAGGGAFSEGVGGTSSSDVWVTWSNGGIQHYNGFAWTHVPHITGATWLKDVWAAAPNNAYAVGWQDMVIHWDGSAWSEVKAVKNLFPAAVDGAGPDAVFIVGLNGDIRIWRGRYWIQMLAPVNEHLVDISVVDENTAYAAVQGGGMLEFDGDSWTFIETPAYFGSIWAPGRNEVFGLHDRVGDIYRWNGFRWEVVPRESHYQFNGKIWGHSRDAFWVVGSLENPGIIIEYQRVK